MPDYTNLSEILSLQTQYLNDLSHRSNDPTVGDNVTKLSNNLDSLHTAYQANDSAILTKQQDVNNLVTDETNRLATKKITIDQALDGQKRLISLNESYRLKYAQYIKMILVAIIALVIWVVLNHLSSLGILPGALYAILMIIVLSVAIFSCYFIYLDILNRDNMNFNELNIPGPKKLTPDEIKQSQDAAAKSGNLLGTINFSGCIGAECCSDGSKWDAGNSVCIGNALPFGRSTTFSGFSTLSVSYNNGELKKTVSANSPNEFAEYSKV